MNRKTPTTPTRRPQRRPRKKAATPRKKAVVAVLDPPILADAEAVDIEAMAPTPDTAPPGPATSVEEGLVAPPLPDVPLAEPELEYAARMALPPPERPVPGSRRAVFFDVENSSHAPYIERTIHRLAIDRSLARTDFVAVGNWRVIGLDTARLLARLGAQLVHSAPAAGVRDWSDLRIAVSAGVWLAAARPGDVIEIVSDDRAFDAIGDVAASLGIEFHRLSHRALSGAPGVVEPREETPAPRGHRRGRRSRRSGGPSRSSGHAATAERSGERRHPAAARVHAPAPPPPPAPALAPAGDAEPHTAPHDEIVQVVQELVGRSPGRPVLIDTLARELKARGFARPPGSPRLITRLRRIRELSVSPTGMITLIGAAQPAVRPVLVAAEPVVIARPVAPEPVEAELVDEDEVDGNRRDAPPAPEPVRQQRPGAHRRRRGGRGRKRATA